jgi:hypothetical protein
MPRGWKTGPAALPLKWMVKTRVASQARASASTSLNDYPVLIAGSGGGYFKNPGVHHKQEGGNTTEVLLSCVRAMGIEATEFGGGDGHVTQSCTGIEG